jgi:hypothetical protein
MDLSLAFLPLSNPFYFIGFLVPMAGLEPASPLLGGRF